MQIQFTRMQAEALMHRLTARTLAEVFADSDELEHLAEGADERCDVMVRELTATGAVEIDPQSEQDREILIDCIEGSTWAACCEPGTPAEHGARRTLRNAARVIEQALGMDSGSVYVPEA